MPDHLLDIYQQVDPEILKVLNQDQAYALSEGALPLKTKLLIAMVLDAEHGAIHGVRTLASQAIAAGATMPEIGEALRVGQFIGGVGCIYTAARALKDILK